VKAASDPTVDPGLVSWVPVGVDSDFPVQNLPFGAFSTPARGPRVGVAIGDHILDLGEAHAAGHLDTLGIPPGALAGVALNPLLECGPDVWRALRHRVSELLTGDDALRPDPERYLVPAADAVLALPVAITDFVDFYSSIHHAGNVGLMFRPDDPPLLPNWRHLPVGYHGRTSTVVASGTPVTRPHGQLPGEGAPRFGPSEKLDFEAEVGFIAGIANPMGHAVAIEDAEGHIFGMTLVNDWSARDLQAWEYRPLGPFLAKSFATTMSPWVVTVDALGPFRVDPPVQDPEPPGYLVDRAGGGAVDLTLTVTLNGEVISRPRYAAMYWTMRQQLAHATVNGAAVTPGDLFASGTVSGPTGGELGCLLELTWNGANPIEVGGERRTFLEDGDSVVIGARAEAEGAVAIGFGRCAGTVAPARDGAAET
jgi:fumarylacetoacetase